MSWIPHEAQVQEMNPPLSRLAVVPPEILLYREIRERPPYDIGLDTVAKKMIHGQVELGIVKCAIVLTACFYKKIVFSVSGSDIFVRMLAIIFCSFYQDFIPDLRFFLGFT